MVVFKVALLVLIMPGTIQGSPVEPRCFSKYDFEEKVLEKSIRTELLMKDYKDKLEIGLETMAAHQNEFKETEKNLEQTAENLKAASDDHMKAQTTKFEDTMSRLELASEEFKATIAERLKLLEERAAEIKDDLATPAISFNVREAADTTPSANQVILFQHIISNIGDAYDVESGIFTAPVNGTYLFGAQVCSKAKNHGIFQIAVDTSDNIILVIADYETDSRATSTSGTAVTYLTSGQKVWVQSQQYSATLYNYSAQCWNQFTGTLIHI